MTKASATKLAKDLAMRFRPRQFFVVCLTRQNGRKTYHVTRGEAGQDERLQVSLSAKEVYSVDGYYVQARFVSKPKQK